MYNLLQCCWSDLYTFLDKATKLISQRHNWINFNVSQKVDMIRPTWISPKILLLSDFSYWYKNNMKWEKISRNVWFYYSDFYCFIILSYVIYAMLFIQLYCKNNKSLSSIAQSFSIITNAIFKKWMKNVADEHLI